MPRPPAAPELTERLALDIGGWDTRYAQVLLIALDGHVGVSIIDPNGDGNITEVEHVYRDPAGRWRAGSSSGGGTPDRYGVHGSGSYGGPGPGTGVRYVYGRAEQPGPLTVSEPTGVLEVTATATGWWAWVRALPDD